MNRMIYLLFLYIPISLSIVFLYLSYTSTVYEYKRSALSNKQLIFYLQISIVLFKGRIQALVTLSPAIHLP